VLKVIFARRRIAQRQHSFRVIHRRERRNVRNSAQLPRKRHSSEVYPTLQLRWRCSALHCETLFLRRSNTRSSAGMGIPGYWFSTVAGCRGRRGVMCMTKAMKCCARNLYSRLGGGRRRTRRNSVAAITPSLFRDISRSQNTGISLHSTVKAAERWHTGNAPVAGELLFRHNS
jgi:hypothetical protein